MSPMLGVGGSEACARPSTGKMGALPHSLFLKNPVAKLAQGTDRPVGAANGQMFYERDVKASKPCR